MIKLMELIARKEGMSVDEFQAYWRQTHAPVMARLPGLKRYIQSHALPEVYRDHPPAYDGLSEAWFEDLTALTTALATAEWQAVLSDSARLAARTDSLVAREVPIIDALPSARDRESMVKYVGLLKRRPELSVAEFQVRWRDVHGPLVVEEFGDLRRYVQSHALPETYEGELAPAYDGVPEAWFESLEVFPWRMVRRSGAEQTTAAAVDSANTFLQPIPSLVTREIVIVD